METTLYTVALAVLFGFLLAFMDCLSIMLSEKYSRRHGMVFWLLTIPGQLVAISLYDWRIGMGAAVVGTIASGAIVLRQYPHRLPPGFVSRLRLRRR